MDNLQVYSIVEVIAHNIDIMIQKNFLIHKKIAIYGLDTFSFAIQSLLLNRNKSADYYVSYDGQEIIEVKRRIKGFASRYLKKTDDTIDIEFVGNLNHLNTVLLIASKLSAEEFTKLKEDGFSQEKNLILLYDWQQDKYKDAVKGKKPISLREMQNLEKEILKDFDEFCLERNLRYWVCGGTLLGTLRHKGFIPWDDDIDVFMPWEDYQKLINIYKDNDKYKLVSLDKREYIERHYCIWGKVIENSTIAREDALVMHCIHPAWIDIFPIIGMPSIEDERQKILREVIEVERKFTENFYKSNGSIRRRNQAYEGIVEISQRYDFDKSEYVGIIGTQYREKDIMTRKVFDETIRMPFEDIEVNVPAGYKEYLDNIYGSDWMEIPDESKRRTHNLEAYWL